MTSISQRLLFLLTTAVLLFSGCDSSSTSVVDETTAETLVAPRAVYILTNSSGTNAIRAYTRDSSGNLTFTTETPTGGSGSGDNLASSGNSLVLESNTDVIYAVNTGSNSISAFYIQTDGTLTQLDVANSGGVRPVSLAVSFNTIYVLNAGDATSPANISGFKLIGGQIVAIDNSTQALSTALPNPSMIAFSSSGTILTVSEDDNNAISTFQLDTNSAAFGRLTHASAGIGPAGLDYTPGGILVSAERNSNQTNAGTASSYQVGVDGAVTLVSSAVPNSQTGPCCVEVLSNGSFALISNSLSNTVSTYAISSDGSVTSTGINANTDNGPAEIVVSEDNLFLYVLNRDSDTVSIFGLNSSTGTLTSSTTLTGLPVNASGMAGR